MARNRELVAEAEEEAGIERTRLLNDMESFGVTCPGDSINVKRVGLAVTFCHKRPGCEAHVVKRREPRLTIRNERLTAEHVKDDVRARAHGLRKADKILGITGLWSGGGVASSGQLRLDLRPLGGGQRSAIREGPAEVVG